MKRTTYSMAARPSWPTSVAAARAARPFAVGSGDVESRSAPEAAFFDSCRCGFSFFRRSVATRCRFFSLAAFDDSRVSRPPVFAAPPVLEFEPSPDG
jgi:hypothetical protein